MSNNNDGRPMEAHTVALLDVIRHELRDRFVIDGEFVVPQKSVIELLLNHKKLKKYELKVETVKLAIKRYKRRIIMSFVEDMGVQICEKKPIDPNYKKKINESTRALLKLVTKDYPVLLSKKFSYKSKIYSDISRRKELEAHSDQLTPEKIYKLLDYHLKASFDDETVKKAGRPRKRKRGPKRVVAAIESEEEDLPEEVTQSSDRNNDLKSYSDDDDDCEISFGSPCLASTQKNIGEEVSLDHSPQLEKSIELVIKLRNNYFKIKLNNRVMNFINMCGLNSLIHAYMHIHVYCFKLTELPDRQNEFYELVTSLFHVSFEEGNKRIGQFIMNKKLFSSITACIVNCEDYIDLILQKLQLPNTASLHCCMCNEDKDYSKIALAFEESDEVRELQFKFGRAVNEFCDCVNNTECPVAAVEPRFNELVQVEIIVNEISPQLPLKDIPNFLIGRPRMELAAIIVLVDEHFYSVLKNENGEFLKYDDTSDEIEIIDENILVNLQHLVFVNKS